MATLLTAIDASHRHYADEDVDADSVLLPFESLFQSVATVDDRIVRALDSIARHYIDERASGLTLRDELLLESRVGISLTH
jgi:hypothetical protein